MRWGAAGFHRSLVLLGVLAATVAILLFFWRPLTIRGHLDRAQRLLTQRDHAGALDELRAALRSDPARADTHLLLARSYRRLGELDKVPALLRRAEALGGDPERVQRERWLLMAQLGNLREAEPHLGELLRDPRNDGADICEAYVLGYFSNLQIRQAEALLDAWEKDFPSDPQPHFMRGYMFHAQSQDSEAVDAYRRGLALAPHDVTARHRLAKSLMQLSDLDQAAAELQQCLDARPQDPEIRTTWAECLDQQGETNRARAVLAQLVAQFPEHFAARRLLGEIELSHGLPERAVPHLESAARLRPYDTTTRNALGRALRALGRAAEAEPHFDYVAEAEESLGRMERQLRLVLERPDDVQLRYEIATTLLKYGSPDDGVRWLRTVLQIQPDHEAALAAMAAFAGSSPSPDAAQRWTELP